MHGAAAFRDRHLQRRRRKIDSHKGGHIGHREVSSSHVRHVLESSVEVRIKIRHAALAAFDQPGNLLIIVRTRERAALEARHRIAHAFHGRGEPVELGPALPHGHECLAGRVAPEQRALGVGFLKIAPNRRDFRDRRAIVEDKNGHLLARIDRLEAVGELFLLGQIHRLERDRNPFLRHEHAHAAGIGRRCRMVKLHGLILWSD
jgi:hypothetical protein